jgi:hypothetical protein
MFNRGWAFLLLIAAAASAAQPDLDPDALAILKETLGSITEAKNFSFLVTVARDRMATNNQLVTYFNRQEVTVSRPDKLRINIDGEHHDVQFYFDGGKATLFEPEQKLYASQTAPSTIGGMIDALDKKGVDFPESDILQNNSYEALAKGLETAYIIGRVNINNRTYVHLVFTGPAADWQLWVEPATGDKLLPRAIVIIYKSEPGSPRVSLDFSDWNLNAQPEATMFQFVKPDDAHEVQFFPVKAGK